MQKLPSSIRSQAAWPLARALAALLLFSACPQSTTDVSVGGHLLEPKSRVFFSGVQSTNATTRVILSDQDGLCARYEDADACTEAAQAATPGEGTFMTLTVTGQAAGDYEVTGGDALRRATVVFTVRSAAGQTFSDSAASGVVTFTDLSPGEGASGRYSLKMSGGGEIEGTFGADACGALDRLVQRVAAASPSCSSTFSPTVCSAKCSCLTRTNTADCSRADSTSDWSCTCVRSGDRTKCSVAKSEANVCTQGNGCCDTSF